MAENPTHVRLAATAKRLIAKHGRALTFIGTLAPSNAQQPWRSNQGSPAEVEALGVVLDYDLAQVDGEHVKRGDKLCYATVPTDNPLEFVKVVDSRDDTIWEIVRIDPIVPGETLITYSLQLRQ